MRLLEFCAETVPRPRQLLAKRTAVWVFLAVLTLLTASALLFDDTLLIVDRPISDALRGWGDLDTWRAVSFLGATEFYLPVALVASALLWKRCRSLALTWPLLIGVAAIVNVVTKALIGRPRPDVPDTGVDLASYPSGHTIHATIVLGLIPPTLYLLTHRSLSAWISYPLLLAAAIVTGLSRVALGAHWLTDVIAGHLIGLFLLVAADLVVEYHRHDAYPRLERLHPQRWPSRV